MDEIAKIALDNEMDLILAHKRSMKLAEMAGLSLSAQTSFATAVSEVARNAIETGQRSHLILSVDADRRDKYIVACLTDQDANSHLKQGLEYAKRLVNKYNISTQGTKTSIELFYSIPASFIVDLPKLDEWRSIFRNEPPVSPYEEIKRKNEQLQDLSERLQKSEGQYKTLTNTLPLIIFALDVEGQLLYANEWLMKFTGETIESLNQTAWRNVVHESDYASFLLLLKNQVAKDATAIKTQARLRHKNDEDYFWHQVSITPFHNDQSQMQYWIGYVVDIHAQKIIEETLKDNAELKQTRKQLEDNQQILEQYIEELNRSNQELQQFAFVASHDLQEPVRKLLFYSDYLLKQYSETMDTKGNEVLNNLQTSAHRMRNLIQDLLVFSQVNKQRTRFTDVDLNTVAKEALQDLEMAIEEKQASIHLSSLPQVKGDERMMRQLFENLISNSLKYSKTSVSPVITIGCEEKEGSCEIVFRDNGIGFDEKYLPQVFTLFQRLHSKENYDGTGLGLAICRKIVEIHNGKIWAKAKENEGASFFVSLPLDK